MRFKEITESTSIASSRPRTSLCTLPDELLGDIFSKLPSTYILPPINRQLLPFHHSQRFRKVVLTFRNFDQFYYLMEFNEHLQQYATSLTLDFSSRSNPKQKNLSPPRRRFINSLLFSLKNLEELVVEVDYDFDERFCPTLKDFSRNPRLRRLAVQASLRGCDEIFEGTEVFDFEALRYVEADDLTDEMEDGEMSEPWMHGILLEVKRLDEEGNYGVRYYTNLRLDYNFPGWCKVSPPITHFETVTLSSATSLPSRLSLLSQPDLLTRLSLFAIESDDSPPSLPDDYLSMFSNITHLSIGGTAYLNTIEFYNTLRRLPLESFCIGPQAQVTAQHVIDLISKPKLETLRILEMDNVDSDGPEVLDEPDQDDFIIPEWTAGCSYAKVRELRELTTRFGIETKGSTFDALELFEAEGYIEALMRLEARERIEAEEDTDKDDDGESDQEWEDYEDEDEDTDEAPLGDGNAFMCDCGRDMFDCMRQTLREIERGE